jgi:hypothetical protein
LLGYFLNDLIIHGGILFHPFDEYIDCEVDEDNEEDFFILPQVLLIVLHFPLYNFFITICYNQRSHENIASFETPNII